MVMIREDLSFSSGGDTCAAWLYPAASGAGARPIIVMAHGLTGTRRDRLGAFADRFAAAGIAALVFGHRGFGDSTGEPDLWQDLLLSNTDSFVYQLGWTLIGKYSCEHSANPAPSSRFPRRRARSSSSTMISKPENSPSTGLPRWTGAQRSKKDRSPARGPRPSRLLI
jgi:fermentation-respiration switch protein FrsA (DUF1100 family)